MNKYNKHQYSASDYSSKNTIYHHSLHPTPVQRIGFKILSEQRVSILFFIIYTAMYRFTEITDFFKCISYSMQVFIYLFKYLETQKCVHPDTHIYAIKNHSIRNPGNNMLRTRKIRLVRILLSNANNDICKERDYCS